MSGNLKPAESDDRIDRMVNDPKGYFSEARKRAEREAEREVKRELAARRRRKLASSD